MIKTILRAVRANLILAPLGIILSLITSVLIARTLGTRVYADYATLMAILAWLVLLAESGCNSGLGRYFNDAAVLKVRYSLYRALQYRRWIVSIFLSVALIFLGPFWAKHFGLPPDKWQPSCFALIGLLATFMLHGQLASSALTTAFRHGPVLVWNQVVMIFRALALAMMAIFFHEPMALVFVLIVVAVIETSYLHFTAVHEFKTENKLLPKGIVNAAQLHGFVSTFDKLTTNLSAGPFLLLVLAGVYSRHELAILAIATDLLQKTITVTCLPVTNMILPLLNSSRNDPVRFLRQIERLGGIVIVLFSIMTGGIAVFIPQGFPLLLGPSYNGVVSIAMIWIIPLFFETGVRMIWGSVLLTNAHYRWLSSYNILFGCLSILVLLMAHHYSLAMLLSLLGAVRIGMCVLLLFRAYRYDLLPTASRPIGILLVSAISCAASLGVQELLPSLPPFICLLAGLFTYVFSLMLFLKTLPLIPWPCYESLCQILGKYSDYLKHFLVIPKRVED
jgi:O-antigen/teichoic acid export membrane protein